MSYVFEPPARPSVAVVGNPSSQDRFWVRRIYCVGRNYAAHAREMGGDDRDPPFFFAKPADAIVETGGEVPYPPDTEDFHYETELVVAIGRAGSNVEVDDALSHVFGYAVGNDLTRRDLQRAAKEARRPWDLSKGFDHSAVVGPIHPASIVGHLAKGSIRLRVNGETKQDADLEEMVWSVPEIVAYLSRSVTIAPGDLILTGTPAGVGPLAVGDVCRAEIEALGALDFTIVGRAP